MPSMLYQFVYKVGKVCSCFSLRHFQCPRVPHVAWISLNIKKKVELLMSFHKVNVMSPEFGPTHLR